MIPTAEQKQGAAALATRLCKRLEAQGGALTTGDINHEWAMYVNGTPPGPANVTLPPEWNPVA